MNETTSAALRPVIVLLMVNLALSALLALAFVAFHASLTDYALEHMSLPPGADLDGARAGVAAGLWSRGITVVIVAVVYVFLVRGLRAGRRRSWLRVVVLSVASLLGIAYLVWSGQYPWWVDVEQGVQAVVVLGLLWAVTRPEVRSRFAKVR